MATSWARAHQPSRPVFDVVGAPLLPPAEGESDGDDEDEEEAEEAEAPSPVPLPTSRSASVAGFGFGLRPLPAVRRISFFAAMIIASRFRPA